MTPGSIQFESDLMIIFDLALRVRLNPQDSLHKQRLFTRLKMEPMENVTLENISLQASDELNKKIILMVTKLREDGNNIKPLLKRLRKI